MDKTIIHISSPLTIINRHESPQSISEHTHIYIIELSFITYGH